MTRNARAIGVRDVRPNTKAKKRLEEALEVRSSCIPLFIQLPSSQPLSIELKDLVWKFRYYLKQNHKALTKFLRSVNWDESTEVQEALALIE